MLVEVIRDLYGYGDWANQRIFTTCEGFSTDQWLGPGTAGRGSVRDTLVHLVAAQRGWLSWWDGSRDGDATLRVQLDPAGFADVAAVRAAWDAVHSRSMVFIAGLTDALLLADFRRTMSDGREIALPLWQMMMTVTNHGTQHRSEVAAMTTAAGHSPGDLDFFRYPGLAKR